MTQQAIIYQDVVYIGKKPFKRDTVYGTRLTFTPGQVHPVPTNIANQMTRHKDVWVLADSPEHKTYLAAAENGELSTKTGPVDNEPTELQKIDELVKALEVDLSKCVRKDLIREHEVTTKLNVEFDEQDKLAEMVAKVCKAYKEYLINKLIDGNQGDN